MHIEIKQESRTDYQEVFDVNVKAFRQDSEARLVDALRKNDEVFVPELSLVAMDNNTVIGHILFTKIAIIDKNDEAHISLALAPMAVHPACQKKGVGGQLIYKGLEIARQLGYKSVIVLGHTDYYPKFGFKPASFWIIQAPFDVPDAAFMAIELVENGLTNISGTVRYPKEFDMV